MNSNESKRTSVYGRYDISRNVTPASSPKGNDDVAEHITYRINEAVKGLFLLLQQFGFKYSVVPSLNDETVNRAFENTRKLWIVQYQAMEDKSPESSMYWMKLLKWKFAAFFFAHSEQLDKNGPQPPKGLESANPSHLCCGVADSYIKMLKRRYPKIFFQFISSINIKLKAACPRPDTEELMMSANATFDALTNIRPIVVATEGRSLELAHRDWADVIDNKVDDVLSRASVKRELERTVDELFGNYSYRDFQQSRAFVHVPSTSANSLASRDRGGSLKTIQNRIKISGFSTAGYAELGPSLINIEQPNKVNDEYIKNDIYRYYDNIAMYDVKRLETNFREFYDNLRLQLSLNPEKFPNDAQIVPLAEALKVRTITKGNAERTFLLQPVQKFLWTTLKNHPAFQLIGETVDPWKILDTLGRKLPEDEGYLSGDYSAATDNLAPWCSEIVVRRICEICEIPNDIKELFIEALTGYTILLKSKNGTRRAKQLWGQLMGSVVSFPILCIINAALCRWAIEIGQGKHVLLKYAKILINGDDCLFRIKLWALPVWKDITTFCGLTPSTGKFFLSRQFVQINSTNFVIDEDAAPELSPTLAWRSNPFKPVSIVNMGLFMNLGRSSAAGKITEDDKAPAFGIGARCRELIRSSPAQIRAHVFRNFIEYHRKTIHDNFKNIPWYVPEVYGGLGLPMFVKYRPVVDPDDRERRDSDILIQDESNNIFFPCGDIHDPILDEWEHILGAESLTLLKNYEALPTDLDRRLIRVQRRDGVVMPIPRKAVLYDLTKIVSQRVPTATVLTDDENLISSWELVTKYLIVDTLFSSTYVKSRESKVPVQMQAVHRIQKIWSKLVRGKLDMPMAWTDVIKASSQERVGLGMVMGQQGVVPLSYTEGQQLRLYEEQRELQQFDDDLWA